MRTSGLFLCTRAIAPARVAAIVESFRESCVRAGLQETRSRRAARARRRGRCRARRLPPVSARLRRRSSGERLVGPDPGGDQPALGEELGRRRGLPQLLPRLLGGAVAPQASITNLRSEI